MKQLRKSRLLMFLVKFPDFIQMVDTACVPALQDFVGILETRVLRLGQCAAARLQNDIRSKMQVIKPVVDHLHFRFAGAPVADAESI